MILVIGVGDDAVVQQPAGWLFLDATDLVTMIVLSDDLVIVFPVGLEEAVDVALCVLILSRHSHGPANVPQPTVIALRIIDD